MWRLTGNDVEGAPRETGEELALEVQYWIMALVLTARSISLDVAAKHSPMNPARQQSETIMIFLSASQPSSYLLTLRCVLLTSETVDNETVKLRSSAVPRISRWLRSRRRAADTRQRRSPRPPEHFDNLATPDGADCKRAERVRTQIPIMMPTDEARAKTLSGPKFFPEAPILLTKCSLPPGSDRVVPIRETVAKARLERVVRVERVEEDGAVRLHDNVLPVSQPSFLLTHHGDDNTPEHGLLVPPRRLAERHGLLDLLGLRGDNGHVDLVVGALDVEHLGVSGRLVVWRAHGFSSK